MMAILEVFRGKNITVYQCGENEVVVYGDGADWIVQSTKITNGDHPWRCWYASRARAEDAAFLVANGGLKNA